MSEQKSLQIVPEKKEMELVAADSKMVFSLTDEQFERALSLYTPPPPTKPSLWKNKTFSKDLVLVVSYLESVQYLRPNDGCFSSPIISNNFDNCMIQDYGGGDDDEETTFTFSVDEWFNDIRGELPDALKDWDPQGHEPMPQINMNVDWFDALTKAELAFPGFVSLFSNCINLEEEVGEQIQKRKHMASTAFGSHPASTKMPDPVNQQADFAQFTPSSLFSGNRGMKFKPSGLL